MMWGVGDCGHWDGQGAGRRWRWRRMREIDHSQKEIGHWEDTGYWIEIEKKGGRNLTRFKDNISYKGSQRRGKK
jgi:hypothetical protein